MNKMNWLLIIQHLIIAISYTKYRVPIEELSNMIIKTYAGPHKGGC